MLPECGGCFGVPIKTMRICYGKLRGDILKVGIFTTFATTERRNMKMKLEQTVTAADANRKFSQLLHGVRNGQRYLVTSHGRPVARVAPADEPELVNTSTREVLLARLKRQSVRKVGRWTRDELYEDAQ
jgi:prevent-host-death family protein